MIYLYKIKLLTFIGLLLCSFNCISENNDTTVNITVPFTKVFYHIDNHITGTFTYNYGLNFLIASGCSYGLIKCGADWNLHELANNNDWIAYSGMPSVMVGGLVPLTIPLGMYFVGKSHNDVKIQYVALAMGQAAILSLVVSSAIKAFTGRRPPGILENEISAEDFSSDFKFGLLKRGAFNGWPSGHTMTAFAMATTLIQFYPDNFWIKAGSLTYATCIGLGVSVNIHWFSDAFAGAFIGYAIGKTVGRGFVNLLTENNTTNNIDFQLIPNGARIAYRF
jgi:membrane-associated phospholipid phosphatase